MVENIDIYSDNLEVSGELTGNIDVSAWHKGFYFVKFAIGDKQFVSNFIKH